MKGTLPPNLKSVTYGVFDANNLLKFKIIKEEIILNPDCKKLESIIPQAYLPLDIHWCFDKFILQSPAFLGYNKQFKNFYFVAPIDKTGKIYLLIKSITEGDNWISDNQDVTTDSEFLELKDKLISALKEKELCFNAETEQTFLKSFLKRLE